jgi:hypothetical protein
MARTDEKPGTVIALFADRSSSEAAISALTDAGFAPGEMAYIGPGELGERDFARTQVAAAGAGSATGVIAGGILGAIAVGAIPGIGPVITAGALVPILIGAVTGGAAGGTMGSLISAAKSNDSIAYFIQEVRSGRSLVAVRTDQVSRARQLLSEEASLEASYVGDVKLPQPGATPQEESS